MAKVTEQPPQDDPTVVVDSTAPVLTQAGEEFKTQGHTRVATHHGYAFRSSNQDLPEITATGVNVTKDQAEFLVAESDTNDGHVYVVVPTENEEG